MNNIPQCRRVSIKFLTFVYVKQLFVGYRNAFEYAVRSTSRIYLYIYKCIHYPHYNIVELHIKCAYV